MRNLALRKVQPKHLTAINLRKRRFIENTQSKIPNYQSKILNQKFPIKNLKSLEFAESTAALLINRQSPMKLGSIEIRPQRLSNVNFRISHLPQQKIA